MPSAAEQEWLLLGNLAAAEKVLQPNPLVLVTTLLSQCQGDLPDLLAEIDCSISEIGLAVVCGSTSRAANLPFSDIDLECLSLRDTSRECVRRWRGFTLSLFVNPLADLLREISDPVVSLWYAVAFNRKFVVHDDGRTGDKFFNALTAVREKRVAPWAGVSGYRVVRRLIEYRRKVANALIVNEPLYAAYCAGEFVRNYLLFDALDIGSCLECERSMIGAIELMTPELRDACHVCLGRSRDGTTPFSAVEVLFTNVIVRLTR